MLEIKHQLLLGQELDAVLTTATTAEWISRLGGKVPIAPVYDVQQALENPFVAEQSWLGVSEGWLERGSRLVTMPPFKYQVAT